MESQKSRTSPVLGNDRIACYLTKLQAHKNYELEDKQNLERYPKGFEAQDQAN